MSVRLVHITSVVSQKRSSGVSMMWGWCWSACQEGVEEVVGGWWWGDVVGFIWWGQGRQHGGGAVFGFFGGDAGFCGGGGLHGGESVWLIKDTIQKEKTDGAIKTRVQILSTRRT